MISQPEFVTMTEKLRVYDVDQAAWEQEPNGFEANAFHVLTHLAKDLADKDFSNPPLVEGAIAPDSVQYAIRLRRWANVETDPRYEPTEPLRLELADNVAVFRPKDAYIRGMGELATHLHNLGHKSERENAVASRRSRMTRASAWLLLSAEMQSRSGGFNLMDAFDNRLAVLRDRFDIPQP